jgi:hypothetical protein
MDFYNLYLHLLYSAFEKLATETTLPLTHGPVSDLRPLLHLFQNRARAMQTFDGHGKNHEGALELALP